MKRTFKPWLLSVVPLGLLYGCTAGPLPGTYDERGPSASAESTPSKSVNPGLEPSPQAAKVWRDSPNNVRLAALDLLYFNIMDYSMVYLSGVGGPAYPLDDAEAAGRATEKVLRSDTPPASYPAYFAVSAVKIVTDASFTLGRGNAKLTAAHDAALEFLENGQGPLAGAPAKSLDAVKSLISGKALAELDGRAASPAIEANYRKTVAAARQLIGHIGAGAPTGSKIDTSAIISNAQLLVADAQRAQALRRDNTAGTPGASPATQLQPRDTVGVKPAANTTGTGGTHRAQAAASRLLSQ